MPQFEFLHAKTVPAELLELIEHAPLPGLDGLPRCAATAKRIRSLLKDVPHLRGSPSEAALWLLAGELDLSHEVSQVLETPDGAYWHGIMHRREGDFWNAKYWFRRAGPHPVLESLAAYLAGFPTPGESAGLIPETFPLRDLSKGTKVAECLVDGCERALASEPTWIEPLQRICWFEWQFLFLHGWA